MNTNQDFEKLAVTSEELQELLAGDDPLLVFDLRLREHYAHGHVEGSVHAVCDSRAKETIMPKIPKGVRIVLIDNDGTMAAETAAMMGSYGLDAHFLRGGIASWKGPLIKTETRLTVEPEVLWRKMQQDEPLFLIDVRQPEEFSDYNIPGSVNIPLGDLFKREVTAKIPRNRQVVAICPHGNRSMVATFALARNGIESVSLSGGLAGWGQVLSPKVVTREGRTVIQVEKVGKGCLSYIAGSKGQAAVIDPVYPAEKYIEFARSEGLSITDVIDTHQHADHVSAARDLARIAGASLWMSGYENYDFESRSVSDGNVIQIGSSKLRAIHTPGHTAGSMSFVLDEMYVFTGDILFVEGIGRPDLRNKAGEFAEELYDTLQKKLLTLPDKTVVLPAHHGDRAGAVTGLFVTTIGQAKKIAILGLDHDQFIGKVVSTTLPKPMNYEKIIQINRSSSPVPLPEVPDLEIGPNRCSIGTA